MSEEQKDVTDKTPAAQPVATDATTAPAAPAPTEKMSETDRLTLELAKSKRQVAVAEAKTALANNDNAELQYRYIVLQLYMKYGLTEADAITEAGEIHRGGAAAAAAQAAAQQQGQLPK